MAHHVHLHNVVNGLSFAWLTTCIITVETKVNLNYWYGEEMFRETQLYHYYSLFCFLFMSLLISKTSLVLVMCKTEKCPPNLCGTHRYRQPSWAQFWSCEDQRGHRSVANINRPRDGRWQSLDQNSAPHATGTALARNKKGRHCLGN